MEQKPKLIHLVIINIAEHILIIMKEKKLKKYLKTKKQNIKII